MARAKTGTLTAGVAATVTVENPYASNINVINHSLDGTPIWVRLDGTAPTVEGDDCHPVFTAREFVIPFTDRVSDVAVKIIHSAAVKYTVESSPKWTRS